MSHPFEELPLHVLTEAAGGSTHGFTVLAGHPHHDEIVGTWRGFARTSRRRRGKCKTTTEASRTAGGADRVIAYLGQTVLEGRTRRGDTMNGFRLALTFGSMAIAAAIGCSSSAGDPHGGTRWLHKCNVDPDCGPGLSCLCNTCTRACGGTDCKNLGASAACVTPTPSGSDSCQLAPGVALCTTACSNAADCSATGSDLRCIGGACLVGATEIRGATSPSNWVTGVLDAYCARAVRCGTFPDGATCRASKDYVFPVDGFNSTSAAIIAESNGTATFDSTAATSCLAALSQLDCDPESWAPSSITAPCDAVFSGLVPDGGDCIDDVECSKGSLCDTTSRPEPVCGGVCAAAPGRSCRASTDCPSGQYCATAWWSGSGLGGWGICDTLTPPGANPGDPCGIPTQCAPGLSCEGGPAPALCHPAASVGDVCGGFVGPSCAPGLACVGSTGPNPGTCMPEAKLGDPCTSLLQCGAQYLVSDIICDMTGSHTCVRRPSTGSCVLMNGVNTCDPTVSYCDGSSGRGTCKPWLSIGAPCVFPTNGFDPCAPGSSCQGAGSAARCQSLQPCTLK